MELVKKYPISCLPFRGRPFFWASHEIVHFCSSSSFFSFSFFSFFFGHMAASSWPTIASFGVPKNFAYK